jgi:two-component system, cell cycle sensor histidine kinase and response regulator CckA
VSDRGDKGVSVEEQWRALYEGSPDFIFTVDLEGRITSLNHPAAGLTLEGVIGLPVLDFVPPEDRATVQALLERVRTSGRPETFQGVSIGEGGQPAYYESLLLPVWRDGQVISLLVQSRDVSQARLASQTLAASEQRFRSMIENSADAICLVDAGGIILYANPSTTRILDYDAASLVGADGWQFIHPDDRLAVGERLAQLLARPGASEAFSRYRMRHRDGSWRWVETVATNLLVDPSVRAIVSTFRDVTAATELEDQLRQAQKMEAIGLLAGGVAHDFNNLLTAVLGFAEHAMLNLPEGHVAGQDLSQVIGAARSAADLTRKLLAFSRRHVMHAQTFELGDLLESFVGSIIQRIVGEDITVALELPRGPLPMRGDPIQLQQVLLNLTTNARQAMPGGGKLRISARPLRDERGPDGPPQRCELVVADSGAGMTEETRRRIYEPFFSARGGTGLGMAVVYGVVQDHKGSIAVDSKPGAGTTVRIELPLTAEPVTPPAVRTPAPVRGGTETLLYAEDQPLVRQLVERTLRRLGYTVLVAKDGLEATEIFAREAPRIALVILDAIMPVMGGRQAFAQMLALRPDLRAVFVSGYAPEASGIGELVASARVAFVHKPFAAPELAARIRELLDGAKEAHSR